MARIEHLTDAQKAAMTGHVQKWLNIGLSTQPADRPKAEAGIRNAYQAAGLTPPRIYIWLNSPYAGAHGAALLTHHWDQVRDQVGAQVGAQVRDQVWAQVGAQVWAQVGAQVGDQVWAQVRAQVGAQVGAQVYKSVWGQHDYWLSFYDYFGQVLELEAPARLSGVMEVAASSGWWWPFENMVILTERPVLLKRDNQGRLHAEDGPAMAYPDGFAIYAWHGTRVPADMVTGPGWTYQRILKEENTEIRRCAIERMGWPEFITAAGLVECAPSAQDPGNPGHTLHLYELPGDIFDETVKVLVCTNATDERDGTRRVFGLTVPGSISSPVAAAAWTFGLNPSDYATMARAS